MTRTTRSWCVALVDSRSPSPLPELTSRLFPPLQISGFGRKGKAKGCVARSHCSCRRARAVVEPLLTLVPPRLAVTSPVSASRSSRSRALVSLLFGRRRRRSHVRRPLSLYPHLHLGGCATIWRSLHGGTNNSLVPLERGCFSSATSTARDSEFERVRRSSSRNERRARQVGR